MSMSGNEAVDVKEEYSQDVEQFSLDLLTMLSNKYEGSASASYSLAQTSYGVRDVKEECSNIVDLSMKQLESNSGDLKPVALFQTVDVKEESSRDHDGTEPERVFKSTALCVTSVQKLSVGSLSEGNFGTSDRLSIAKIDHEKVEGSSDSSQPSSSKSSKDASISGAETERNRNGNNIDEWLKTEQCDKQHTASFTTNEAIAVLSNVDHVICGHPDLENDIAGAPLFVKAEGGPKDPTKEESKQLTTLQVVLKKLSDTHINHWINKLDAFHPAASRLKYKFVHLGCKQGKMRETESKGLRPNQRTLKTNCKAYLRIATSEIKGEWLLRVTGANHSHENHPLDALQNRPHHASKKSTRHERVTPARNEGIGNDISKCQLCGLAVIAGHSTCYNATRSAGIRTRKATTAPLKLCQCQTRREQRLIKCNLCHETFDQNSHLLEHKKSRHAAENPFKCNQCHMSFRKHSHLLVHMRTHTGQIPFKRKQCQMNFTQSSHLAKDIKIHSEHEPLFRCDHCEKNFSHKHSLKIHMRTHTEEKLCKCNQCHMSFRRGSHLLSHMRTHTGEKPFKCDLCHKGFMHDGSLVVHMRVHRGENPFKCNQCHKSFKQSGHLASHLKIHSGDKPFKCDLCQKSFTRKSSLKIHLRTHTGGDNVFHKFRCDQCQKSFLRKNTLERHMITHTKVKPFQCNDCQKTYRDRCALSKHMKTHTDMKDELDQ